LRLTGEALRVLAAHSWPGNVRELGHVIEAGAALAGDGRILPEHLDLGPEAPPDMRHAGEYHVRVEAFRRRLIEDAIAAAGGGLAGRRGGSGCRASSCRSTCGATA